MTDFDTAAESFIAKIQTRINHDYTTNYPRLRAPKVVRDGGSRWAKFVRNDLNSEGKVYSASVHVFIDTKAGPTYGNIHKAASYKAPAKKARGNIFADDNGDSAIGSCGTIVYLR